MTKKKVNNKTVTCNNNTGRFTKKLETSSTIPEVSLVTKECNTESIPADKVPELANEGISFSRGVMKSTVCANVKIFMVSLINKGIRKIRGTIIKANSITVVIPEERFFDLTAL